MFYLDTQPVSRFGIHLNRKQLPLSSLLFRVPVASGRIDRRATDVLSADLCSIVSLDPSVSARLAYTSLNEVIVQRSGATKVVQYNVDMVHIPAVGSTLPECEIAGLAECMLKIDLYR